MTIGLFSYLLPSHVFATAYVFRQGFIEPRLPTSGKQPPSGPEWLHEIKHDGFRVIARKDDKRVKLYSRPGNNLTDRFPLIKNPDAPAVKREAEEDWGSRPMRR